MSRTTQIAVIALAAIAAAAGGYGIHAWQLDRAGSPAAEALLAAQLDDLEGHPQPLAQWRGKVLVVNFWATWCEPCREEIPVFVRLQHQYGPAGLQFVGIAIDQRAKVQVFARDFGINYPVLIGRIDTIDLSRRAGNRPGALPHTVIIGRDGRIAAQHLGALKENRLLQLIGPLLLPSKSP